MPAHASRRRAPWILGAVAGLVALGAVAWTVDAAVLGRIARDAAGDPVGLAVATAAFALAFVVRSWAWHRVHPQLPIAHAWAGIHLALAANHLLPLRLGEVVRPLSTTRRTGLPLDALTASTVALRSGDLLALAAVAGITGPTVARELLGSWVWVAAGVLVVAGAGGVIWLRSVRRRGVNIRVPGVEVALACAAAWPLEAAVVHSAAGWAGHPLAWSDAVLVTAVAVLAQVVAIAPGGFGTYEAAATAALVAVGVPAGPGLAIALAAHALKTAYSLGAGAVALWYPDPALAGRLRLPRRSIPRAAGPVGDGPIVLVLPAHDEAARVAAVVRRLPATVATRPTRCIVVDDGSSDDTAREAEAAGATVVRHANNRGLGAAVRTGFTAALDAGAAVVAFCDADGEYAPEELERVVTPIIDGSADYVVGSRFRGTIEHMRPHRRLGNLVLTGALRWSARAPITDGQSGYRALSREAGAAAEIAHDYNYAQVLTLDLLGKGFRYAEVPITYRFRESGRSFVRLGRYLVQVVSVVWRVLNPSAPQSSTTWSRNVARAAAQ
ncbi:MAG TPA: glycosyltransferase [Acidimicrobiales bacterium]|nr:glycosyltransferase [Acidimicrobiales bacterium]